MDSSTSATEPLLFISHAVIDREIAHYLKEMIHKAHPAIAIFVSSDPEDLPVGDPWVEKILMALDRARLVVVLATERGLGRKWVWFEAGAGWDKRRKIVSRCAGKTRKNSLPPPFGLHTALNIDESEDSANFFNLLAKEFGGSDGQIDHGALTKEVTRLDVRAEERGVYSVVADEEKPFFEYQSEMVKKKLKDIDQGGRDLLRLVMTNGEIDNSRIYAAWRRTYDLGSTIKVVVDSGLVTKRPDRVNNIEVGWSLRVNPDLQPLLKKLLFPIDEPGGPFFQI
jgi:hypothetical protein